MPEVSGDGLRLLGIDFTTIPGIETVTVEDVTLESFSGASNHTSQDINEVFELPTESLLLEEVEEEEYPTVDSSAHAETSHDLLIANKNDLHMIHDHIAMAQGRSCAPASMSPEFAQAIIAALRATESGRKFSQATMSQLDMAHDKAAEVLGIECSNDNMQDGDADDAQSNEHDSKKDDLQNHSSQNTTTQETVPDVIEHTHP